LITEHKGNRPHTGLGDRLIVRHQASEEGLTNVSEAVISSSSAAMPEIDIAHEPTTFPQRSVTVTQPVRGWRRIDRAQLTLATPPVAIPVEQLGKVSRSAAFTKRGMDLLGSTLLLILLSPLFLVIALAIKMSDPSAPVFYTHRRVGKGGRTIKVIKFRSMHNHFSTGDGAPFATPIEAYAAMGRHDLCEEFAMSHKVAVDPRVTTIGGFLRRTSLDELPQILSAWRGDLSLVGPRPITAEEVCRWGDGADTLLAVKPGITGLWQVSGRSDVSFAQRVEFDLFYVRHWNIWMDVKILLRTIPAVLHRRGAY
jgi:lipopolysaccharide/colanic/teichoic acid biosynthesis glycosyltransferase